jgi:hypothetical protein
MVGADPDDAVFVLGLGAQRAATTWLWWYLRQHEETDLGALKEYHVWDAVGVSGLGYFSHVSPLARLRRGLARRGRGRVGSRLARRPRRRGADLLRERLQRDPEQYFDYFAGLLARDGVRLTADITPSYCALDAETLGRIREGFRARGIDVRVVYLMRDPVERCRSAVMLRRHAARVPPLRGLERELRRYAVGRQARLRTDYPRTLAAIDAAFDPEQVFLGFYETLFTAEEVERLSRFLGIEPAVDLALNRVHGIQESEPLSPRTTAYVREAYADVYAACAERFPVTREIWSSAHPA